jgi:hypothetical protein
MFAKFALVYSVVMSGLLSVAAVKPVDVDTPLPITAAHLDTGFGDQDRFSRTTIPPRIRLLHGRRVSLRTFIYPTIQETDLSHFVAAVELKSNDPDPGGFGTRIRIHRLVQVQLRDGQTIDYISEPVRLEGRLFIDYAADEKGVYRLYKLIEATASKVSRQPGFRSLFDVSC